jgi:hypothetical protein
MSRPHRKDVQPPKPPVNEPAMESVGKVVVDNRGRNVWKWAKDVTKDVLDSTSVLLKRLENKDLALEPTRKVPVISEKDAKQNAAKPGDSTTKAARGADSKSAARHPALQRERRRDGDGGGFDPYNSR